MAYRKNIRALQKLCTICWRNMGHAGGLRSSKLWGEVLQGDLPCGADLSLTQDFETLREEIDKDTSIHSDQKTDWSIVYELADILLACSKDLWAYAYGTVAVYHTKNIPECVDCINVLGDLMASQWENLHPSLKRPQRRVAPLKWLCNKFHRIAENTAFFSADSASLHTLNTAFVNLQTKLDALIPDNDLTFKSILHAQLSTADTSENPRSRPAPQKAARASSGSALPEAQPLHNTLDAIEKSSHIPPAALPQVIRATNDNSRQLGDHLLAINPLDERGYQLHRVALWSTLLHLPSSDADGVTQLSCPIPPDTADMFVVAVNDKRYSEVLPQIERAASKAPFWLDGQYLVVRCLEGLNAAPAISSIKHFLTQLLTRFPDIPALRFKDGKPFASPKTAAWLESFNSQASGESPFTGNQPSFQGGGPTEEGMLLQEAISCQLENGFEAGLKHLGKVHPGRSRAFMKHCILRARYCAAIGRKRPAVHLLKSVFEKLKQWDLLDWEPDLSAEAVSLLLALTATQKKTDEEMQNLLYLFNLERAIEATKDSVGL